MVGLDFLEKVDLFKDLDDGQLAAIRGCCQETEFSRHERIFGVKDVPVSLWVVMEGEVDLRQDQPGGRPELQDSTITTLEKAHIFGWSSLIPPFKYRLSAYCASRKCKVVKIEKECLTGLLEKDSRLGYLVMSQILAVVGHRFDELRETIIKNMGQDILNQW